MYKARLIASSDHKDLETMFNAWLVAEEPARIQQIEFVADGAEYTYCVLILYTPKKAREE